MKYSVLFVMTATMINAVHISATDSRTQKDTDIFHNRQKVPKLVSPKYTQIQDESRSGWAEANSAAQRAFGGSSAKVNKERQLKKNGTINVSVDSMSRTADQMHDVEHYQWHQHASLLLVSWVDDLKNILFA